MSFETTILNKVAATVGDQVDASFSYGTLFVQCTAGEAAKIETALINLTRRGVIVSKTPAEFAFDFTE